MPGYALGRMPTRVLLVSNLDSDQPFGQFLRPFHLGRGLSRHGLEVANVGVNCSRVDFGPSWSTGVKSLARLARLAAHARREFQPDVVYAHELRPATASIMALRRVPVVVDLHSLPSVEWRGYVAGAPARDGALYRVAGFRAALSERLIARRADRIIAAGANVAARMNELYRPRVAPEVVVNGVDRDMLAAPVSGSSPYDDQAGAHAMTTLPAAITPSNDRARRFLEAVDEELRRRSAPVTLHVIGGGHAKDGPGLQFHGYQPELTPWIDHADACLLPYPPDAALCGGPRNKLLEYLARGRSIVTTEEGTRGLEEVADWPGVHVAGDEPATFAAAVAAAIEGHDGGLEARQARIRARLEWDTLAAQVAEVLSSAAARDGR